jgi:O-6-methylguanine DNA methyltransferase
MDNTKNITFKESVFSIIKKIPKGHTLTYKQVAKLAGRPTAYRAVGNILNKNYDPAIPCHRVVRSDGKVGGYNRGSERKRKILEEEKQENVNDIKAIGKW